MDRRLFQPRWLVAHTVVLAVVLLFVFLGFWQLRRHDERVGLNEVGESRLDAPAEDIGELLAGNEIGALQYRRVTASGEYAFEHQVLIRSQIYRGTAGFHVVTPLLLDNDTAVLVNRGWVPLDFERLPSGEVRSPAGQVTIEAWVELSQERPPLGPEDPPEGVIGTLNRVDVDRIAQQIPVALVGFYVVETGEQGQDLPVPLNPPAFDDDGPHLAYAIQWFGFAAVGLVGYFFLARRRLVTTSRVDPRWAHRGRGRTTSPGSPGS